MSFLRPRLSGSLAIVAVLAFSACAQHGGACFQPRRKRSRLPIAPRRIAKARSINRIMPR